MNPTIVTNQKQLSKLIKSAGAKWKNQFIEDAFRELFEVTDEDGNHVGFDLNKDIDCPDFVAYLGRSFSEVLKIQAP